MSEASSLTASEIPGSAAPLLADAVIPGVSLLFLDAHILVCDKPSGLLSVPGRLPENKDSLALRAEQAFPGARTVHRLDCDTSGVIVLARDPESHRNISLQFQNREVVKDYIALAHGTPQREEGEIDLALIVDWPNRPRSKVDPNGKPARTHWRVLQREATTTRFLLTPITGRSHQLRIHLAEIGHPILGDPFYAPSEIRALAPRLLLHAQTLSLKHPKHGTPLKFTAPCPF